ncbi:MAG TPA: S-layer homology domain-containing protein [Candidatus Avacidaminococcus intestinavium]|uniref:S-layer homology domain-containing protein n=1 Tax=Candidatus Avacidaminococcus intestinavium TaxID=2840684 RepID=A0A9D1MPB3_9FIRM|nr:S-layer homology domain-containing protein [Candidatus Avacidaminococcus intestinavium]
MNKIFKVIWSKARSCYMVVSELANGNTKASTPSATRKARQSLTGLCAIQIALLSSLITFAPITPAFAALEAGTNITIEAGATELDQKISTSLTPEFTSVQAESITSGSITIGTAASKQLTFNEGIFNLGDAGSISVGDKTYLSTTGLNANNQKISGVLAGDVTSGSTDAVNGDQLYEVQQTAQQGFNVQVGATPATQIAPGDTLKFTAGTNLTLTNTDGTIDLALSATPSFTSVKTGNTTVNNSGLTIGTGASAISLSASGLNNGGKRITGVAEGTAATDAVNKAQMEKAITDVQSSGTALKYFKANSSGEEDDALASGQDAIAIGKLAKSTGDNAIALGKETAATGSGALALGVNSTTNGDNTVAIGNGAKAQEESALAIGENAEALDEGAIALGKDADAKYKNSIAIGTDSVAQENGIATGLGSNAEINALALGTRANANGAQSIALGLNSHSNGEGSLSLGSNSYAAGARDISLGQNAGTNSAGGDPEKLKHDRIAIGTESGSNNSGNENIAIGYKAGGAVSGDSNVAIGSLAGSNIEGDKNTSIGFNAAGSGSHSTAIGAESKAHAGATAIGDTAKATGKNSVAVGYGAQSLGDTAIAIGQNAVATDNSIALGNASTADQSISSAASYLTKQSAGSSGVISVGSDTIKRRIVHVADGSEGNDAVNVNQLKAAQTTLANLIGGGVTLTGEGNYSKFKLLKKDGDPHNPADYMEFNTVAEAMGQISAGEINVALADAVKYTDAGRGNINADATISNVKNAITNDQAVNLGQMNTAIEDSRIKYYSVKSDSDANRDNSGASGSDSMAIGPAAKAVGEQSISIGLNTKSEGDNSIVIGNAESSTEAKQAVAYNKSGIAIGTAASSAGDRSIAFGYEATTQRQNADLSSNDAIAFGTKAKATADRGVAIGSNAVASGINAFAQGTNSNAINSNTISIGANTTVAGNNALALGSQNRVRGANSGVIGTNMTGDNAAANYLHGSNTYVVGNANGDIAGHNSSIIGNQNKIGDTFTNDKEEPESIFSTNTGVLGNNNSVTSHSSSVIGYGNTLGQKPPVGSNDYDFVENSGVFGNDNQVLGNNNRVLGNNNKDHNQDKVFILGNNVGNTSDILANSVYLGDNTTYEKQGASTQGNKAYDKLTDNKKTYTFAGGTVPAGVVSIGSVGAERRIQNVSAGLVTASSTDAINGSQLYALTRPLGFKGDQGEAIKRGSDQTLDIIGGATAPLTNNNIGVINDKDKLAVKLAENITDLSSIKFKNSTIELTVNGLNNGGNKITGVAEGTVDTDAVNLKQLKVVEQKANAKTTLSDGKNTNVTSSTNNDGTLDYKVNLNDKITLGTGDNQVTINGEEGKITAGNTVSLNGVTGTATIGNVSINGGGTGATVNGLTNKTWDPTKIVSGQAATEDQLQKVSQTLDGGLTFAGNKGTVNKKLGTTVNIVGGILDDSKETSTKNVKTVVNEKGDLEISLAEEVEFKKVTTGGVYINGSSVSLTDAGLNNGGNKITNVGTGTADTDAVNVGQMKDYVNNETTKTKTTVSEGNGIKVEKSGPEAGPNDYKVSLQDSITLGEGNNAVQLDGKNGKIQVGGADGISIDGKDGHIDGLKNTTWDPETTGKTTPDRAATEGQLQGLYQDVNTKIENVNNKVEELDATSITGGKIGADGKITLKKKDSKPDITLEGTLHDYALDDNNGIGYAANDNGDVTMKVVDKYNESNSYDVKIKDVASKKKLDDLTSTVGVSTKEEMKERYKETNFIKDAKDMADADVILDREIKTNRDVLEQHGDQINNITNNVNKLGSRVDKVGAGAAALAALHPLEFDPDTKLSFAAGVGNYKGETAGAIGAFYRPDEKVMLNLGGTIGNGENMVNMGVSFALDRTSHVNNSKVAMAKELVDLRKQVADLTMLVMQNNTKGYDNLDLNRLFPDVAENHWAYEYVSGLAKQGVIEGYPDGNFGGDRMMTRYEFATMLYRAMQRGVNIESRLINEFEAELGRIRVDRISGEDNDRRKVERVRVNGGESRDKYGSEITAK